VYSARSNRLVIARRLDVIALHFDVIALHFDVIARPHSGRSNLHLQAEECRAINPAISLKQGNQ